MIDQETEMATDKEDMSSTAIGTGIAIAKSNTTIMATTGATRGQLTMAGAAAAAVEAETSLVGTEMKDDIKIDKGQNLPTISRMDLSHLVRLLDRRHLSNTHLAAGDSPTTRITAIPMASKGRQEA